MKWVAYFPAFWALKEERNKLSACVGFVVWNIENVESTCGSRFRLQTVNFCILLVEQLKMLSPVSTAGFKWVSETVLTHFSICHFTSGFKIVYLADSATSNLCTVKGNLFWTNMDADEFEDFKDYPCVG